MARGRRTSLTICLTAKERRTLLAWQHSTTMPAGHARRGRVILLVARRVSISHLADTVGVGLGLLVATVLPARRPGRVRRA